MTGHFANASVATQIAGVIGSCRWRTSKRSRSRVSRTRPIALGERTMFGSEPFAGTTTERPTGMIPDGRSPWRPGARVEQARCPPGRVVAHQDRDVVAAIPERRRLVLGVLDHAAPVRPRERDDDARPSRVGRLEHRCQALDALVEDLVGDREREARPAGAARAEALSRGERDAMLGEQPLRSEPAGSRSQT